MQGVKNLYVIQFDSYLNRPIFRDGPFDIQGWGAGIFLKKIVCFHTEAKKIKCLQRS